MALDVLPVKASSVACERVFSSSKETRTERRNRIGPQLLEATQVLKYALRQGQLDFTDKWTSNSEELALEDIGKGNSASHVEGGTLDDGLTNDSGVDLDI